MKVNGIEMQFNYKRQSMPLIAEVNESLLQSLPFKMVFKNMHCLVIPNKMLIYRSDEKAATQYSTPEALSAEIGMLMYACKSVELLTEIKKSPYHKITTMLKIKLKQTMMGGYGLKKAGETAEYGDKAAHSLVERGLADWAEGEEPTEPAKEDEAKPETKKPDPEKASVKITDNSNKEKKEILKP